MSMGEIERQFICGNRDPNKYGIALRASNGTDLDHEAIEKAAPLLGREPLYTDSRGYECELIGAAIHPCSNHIAYVESRAKKRWWSSLIDVSIKVHLRDPDGSEKNVDIKSYNPFFGCDIGFFRWIEDVALLIYSEKHRTYICAFGLNWPPNFVEIEDYWIITGQTLGYIGYKQDTVKRLSIPDLLPLESISINDSRSLELLPDNPYVT